jgi:hypothetical protein
MVDWADEISNSLHTSMRFDDKQRMFFDKFHEIAMECIEKYIERKTNEFS